jgi:hypothetical protein
VELFDIAKQSSTAAVQTIASSGRRITRSVHRDVKGGCASWSRHSSPWSGWQCPAICRRSRPAVSRRVNIVAAILQTPVIEKILAHLSGLQAQAPPRAPTRGQVLQAA